MEEEVNKAINTTVFKEYGAPDHSKVTKAINFAQENVSNKYYFIFESVFFDVPRARNISVIALE